MTDIVGRSAKRESEQARAKQHKARRGYREESIGHEIMMTHGAPAAPGVGPAPDVGPNLFKNLEIGFLAKGAASRDQALERKPSRAWARKMLALMRAKTIVTVSIIADVLEALPDRTTCRSAQSKEFRAAPKIGI
jgi:hypothetical protein